MKYLTSTIVRASDIALNNNLFGGTLLRWLDEYGALFTYKYLHHTFVTYKMGDIYFLKSAKIKDIIDFYITDIKFGKMSVTFTLIARINGTNTDVIKTEMTFVAINTETEKPALLNPLLFEKEEFEKFILQKVVKSKLPEDFNVKWSGNIERHRKKFIISVYTSMHAEKADAIMALQKDWGKIFDPAIMTEFIQEINKQETKEN